MELKKNEQNLQKKKEKRLNGGKRRLKILDKNLQTQKRIKKQKEEKSKDLLNKYFSV